MFKCFEILHFSFTFRLDPSHTVKRKMSAVMRTQNGMYMFVEKRRPTIH
jgi:hypothetical protein